jgi:hypothetical protein
MIIKDLSLYKEKGRNYGQYGFHRADKDLSERGRGIWFSFHTEETGEIRDSLSRVPELRFLHHEYETTSM